MSEFFENLKANLESSGKAISEKAEVVAGTVAKKVEKTVEVQKVKSQIHGLELSCERDFQSIGKKVYESYRKGEVVGADYVELCEAISVREERIANCKKQIAEMKGLDVCPNCKEHVEADASYCPKCGAKLEEETE